MNFIKDCLMTYLKSLIGGLIVAAALGTFWLVVLAVLGLFVRSGILT